MNTTHLIGSEDVARAGHNIQAAAGEISRAASAIDQAAAQIKGALDAHGYMLSALMERMDAMGPRRAVSDVNGLHWAANSLKASRWTLIFAKLFGKRLTGTDGPFTAVGYEWRGVIYMTDFTKDIS